MVQSDSKRIVWHPTKPRRFAIGGAGNVGNAGGTSVGQIKVYDWDGSSEIAEVTTLGDLIHMKCFALSPHPLDTDLIAVGTTQGKVELLRFSITHPPNTLRSPAVSSLPSRSSRACNALAFSSYDPNYLAVGLDKVRGEPSLVIWDIETTSSKVFTPKMAGGRADDTLTPLQTPPDEFTPKALLFTRSDPLLPSNIPPNIPRYDRNIIQQWLHTETVTSLSFMPHTTDLIVAGVSHRWIRLFDLRSPSGMVGFTGGLNTSSSGPGTAAPSTASLNPQSIATKSVYGLCTNPFDHHQFASFSEDGVVRMWDYRYFTSPVLSFSEKDALADGGDTNPITAIEFSKTRRGSILSLEKDAYAVRFWDTIRATVEERWDYDITISGRQGNTRGQNHTQTGQGEGTSRISKLARLPWSSSSPTTTPAASLSSTAEESSTTRPFLTSNTKPSIKTEYIILRNTRTSSRFFRPLASFTSIPHPSHWGWSSKSDEKHGQTVSMAIAVLTKDGELDMQTIYDAPVPQWSARGELSVNFGRGYRVYQPRDEEDTEDLAGSLSGLSFRGKDKKFGRQRQGDFHAPSRPSSLKRFPLSNSTTDLLQTPRPGALTLLVEKEADPNESRGRTIAVDAYAAQVPTHGQGSAAARSRRSISKGKLSTGERSSRRTIMDDVSMVMKRRAVKGYGLDSLDLNANIVKSDTFYTDTLYELWTWIESSRTLLSRHPRIHGFNFSYQGVYGIWEGFPAEAKAKHLQKERDGGREKNKETVSPEASSDIHLSQDNEHVRNPSRGHSRSRNPTSTSTSSTLSTPMSMYRSHSPSSDYTAALQVLSGYYIRNEKDRILDDDVLTASSNVKIAAPTSKPVQRKLCLLLCGWCLSDQDLLNACAQWERDGQLTRAACWLLFINHQDKAIECLMRSDDERLRIMSGTIAALLVQQGTSNQVREHYNRLIVRIEDPYIRVMLTHVALDDWSDILQEESLPLRERLAIAFRFLDDRSLSSYLRRLTDTFRQRGDIEGVILTGLTPLGFEVIQGYVDTTGDVQTASILASLTVMSSATEARIWAQRWIEAYRNSLDMWQMFHFRCQFDISRGKIMRDTLDREWEDIHSHTVPHQHPHVSSAQGQTQAQIQTHPELDWTRPQIAIRCPFCKKNVNLGLSPRLRIGDGGKIRVNCCQTCGRSLPRCAICLVVLGLGYDLERDPEMTEGSTEKNTLNNALVFCQTCKHGGHASHMLEWFYGSDTSPRHNECPVPGCDCLCGLR